MDQTHVFPGREKFKLTSEQLVTACISCHEWKMLVKQRKLGTGRDAPTFNGVYIPMWLRVT